MRPVITSKPVSSDIFDNKPSRVKPSQGIVACAGNMSVCPTCKGAKNVVPSQYVDQRLKNPCVRCSGTGWVFKNDRRKK